LTVARTIGAKMAEVGLDRLRGGVFDCVERRPSGPMPTQFAWEPTKDFWQQEQGILAYLILHGATADAKADNDVRYLRHARDCSAFWNLFFLDRERQGYFFRTTENGLPILEGQYGQKSSHAIGYHAFELGYLAHVYMRTFVSAGRGTDNAFCLYFKILSDRSPKSINVLPDFMPPGVLAITEIRANGIDVTDDYTPSNANDFQISLQGLEPSADSGAIELAVTFTALAPRS